MMYSHLYCFSMANLKVIWCFWFWLYKFCWKLQRERHQGMEKPTLHILHGVCKRGWVWRVGWVDEWSGLHLTWLNFIYLCLWFRNFLVHLCMHNSPARSNHPSPSTWAHLDLWNSHSGQRLCLDPYPLQLTAGWIAIQSSMAHQLLSHVSTSRLSALCMSMRLTALMLYSWVYTMQCLGSNNLLFSSIQSLAIFVLHVVRNDKVAINLSWSLTLWNST